MPDISTCIYGSIFFVVGACFYSIDDFLSSYDLVRSHDQEWLVSSENTIFSQNIQVICLAKKSLQNPWDPWSVYWYDLPPSTSKFKTIAWFFTSLRSNTVVFFDMCKTGRITVILRMRTIWNHKELYILKTIHSLPKRFSLITIDLIKCFFDRYSSFLEFDMDEW